MRVKALSLFLSLLVSGGLFAQDEFASIREFLNSNQVIRVPMVNAEGRGHESTALTLITRLRQLGYENSIELLYENTEDMNAKLQVFFPDFKSGEGSAQFLESQKLKLISYQKFLNSKPPTVALAIQPARIPETPEGMIQTSMFYDRLFDNRFLQADVHLLLNPPSHGPPTVFRRGRKTQEHVHLTHAPFQAPKPELGDPKEWIASDLARQNHSDALPYIEGLLNRGQPAETLLAYGMQKYDPQNKLARYLFAYLKARAKQPSAFQGPLFVTLASPWDAQSRKLFELILSADKRLAGKVEFFKPSDPKVARALASRDAGKIFVVETGPLPSRVFRLLGRHSSLPPTVAGVNATHEMRIDGVVHMHTFDEGVVYERLPEPRAQKLFELARDDLMGRSANSGDDIAEFILESRRPQSSLKTSAAALSENMQNLQGDRIVLALADLQATLATEVATSSPCASGWEWLRDAMFGLIRVPSQAK